MRRMFQFYSDLSASFPQSECLAMSLWDKNDHEHCFDGADGAEKYKEPGVTNQVDDRRCGLDCYEDHQELEGDDGAADQGLQVRGKPLGCKRNGFIGNLSLPAPSTHPIVSRGS